jgi:hypothetical protein
MTNYSQILQTFQKNKTKSTQGGERGEIVVGCCMLEFVYQAGSQGDRDARTGPHYKSALKPSTRTHACINMNLIRGRGRPSLPFHTAQKSSVDHNQQINLLILSFSVSKYLQLNST